MPALTIAKPTRARGCAPPTSAVASRRTLALLTRWALASAAMLTAAAPAAAQGRELYWESLDVTARLDAEGRLHVAERQTYVFTGDWNGGERRFEVGVGQSLDLAGVTRIDPATGEARPLARGDLDQVDQYDWAENRTLRWRSRLPSDPPFDRTRITYLLEYVYEGVVRGAGADGRYRLSHDFAFPDRTGVIERYRLDLEPAAEWRVDATFEPRLELRDLQPGQGVIVTLPLTYLGAGRPSAAVVPLPFPLRAAAGVAFAVGLAVILGLFLSDQERLGRFARRRAAIDRAWVAEHLLAMRAEEVGALWDRRVGPPEVAALVARLVAEGKLESRVEEKKGLFGKPVLHLKLLVERGELTSYERSLVNGLFWDGRTETDTKSLRTHYRGKGFDPAALIKPGVEQRLAKRFPDSAPGFRRPSRRVTAALFLAGLVGLAVESVIGAGPGLAVILAFCYPGPYGIALAGAHAWRSRVEALARSSLVVLLALVFIWAPTVVLLFFREIFGGELALEPGLGAAAALVLLPLALTRSIVNMARSRESAETIARRRDLAGARRWFARELRRREPRLEDAWFPYLLALGLGPRVDRWFRAFGDAAATGVSTTSSHWSGSSSGGGGGLSSGGGWSGGGGAFGGAGATAAWGVAAAGMSAGVAAPSSSGGGGGGGGGGGSSGGGGGGGW